MNLAVIGCGKMGLPLAVQAARRGLNVIAVDINPDIVSRINKGEGPIDEPGVEDLLKAAVSKGSLKATLDLEKGVSCADAVIVIVPVTLDSFNQGDLGMIKEVTEGISRFMKRGAVISFETTLPVGATRNILKPLLENRSKEAEKDFYLVFSPERVKSLMVIERLNKIPKVVGGVGPRSLQKGIELYKAIVEAEVIGVGSLENAEMVKIAGMIYRDVNIGLVNEMARYCDRIGLNLSEIIRIANTNGEANLLEPGIGVGGHCTPIYPYFLINDAKQKGVSQSLAEAARKVNDRQAEYIVNRLENQFGNLRASRILLLGLGFRPGIKEDAYSSAYLVQESLKKRGAETFLYDPLYKRQEITQRGFVYSDLYNDHRIDALILVTAHRSFLTLDWERLKAKGVRVFVDGRNCFKRNEIEKLGIKYIGIGSG